MEPLRLLILFLLLAGVAAATDYGTVSTLDFSLSPGGSATKIQEVSRCRDGGCTDTLRLAVSVPSDLSAQVSPPEVKVERARAGQSFSVNVTVAAQATTPAGRYEGSLQTTSGSGDTWKYRLNITVGQTAPAPPAAGRATPGTGGATSGTTGGAASGTTSGATAGSNSTLLIAGGVAAVAVVLLVLLQRRGLLPRGVPRPAPRGKGRGTRAPSPPGAGPSPISALLRPVGAIAGRMKGLTARGPFGSRARERSDAEFDSEWRRFISERLPGEEVAGTMEAPAEEAPPPVVGDAPPEEAAPPEAAEPTPESEFIEPGAPEPPAAVADSGPEPAEGEGERGEMEAEPTGPAPQTIPGGALAALQRDVERLRAGMGNMADLKTMVERSLDDLRTLREEVDRVRSAPRPAGVPMVPGPAMVPPDALKKMQAEVKQEMSAAVEAQMTANVEKLGTWLREALKAVTLMKAQAPQAGGAAGTASSLQPLFDGLWKEVGSLRSAIQRLEAETKASLQEVARQRAPGESFVKEAATLRFALEKQQAEMAVLAKEVGALRAAGSGGAPESGVALQADLEALRSILRDHQRQMEGVEARLKNQELTFARGDEVRNLFRDLSALKEDLAQARMVLEESALRVAAAPAVGRAPAVMEMAAPPPAAGGEGPQVEEARREIEKQEAFLKSLEEYHRSGLMPERLYLEKRGQSEERLRELKRKLRS